MKQTTAAPSHVCDFLNFVAAGPEAETETTADDNLQHVGLLTLVTDALASAAATDPGNPIYQLALDAVEQEKQVFRGA